MCDIMRKEKEIHDSFAVLFQSAKVTTTVYGKCLVKMENAKPGNVAHMCNPSLEAEAGGL
jgi:hypothetical protein